MNHDRSALGTVLEQSDDLHADAMRSTRASLDELVGHGRERRSRAGLLAAGAVAMTAVGLVGSAVGSAAAATMDLQLLQTAASIENLAVATYGVALALPFVGGTAANPLIKAFVEKTRGQHAEHATALNAAVRQLGGREQRGADPVLLEQVSAAKPMLTSPEAVIDLALALENGAAQTYVRNVSIVADLNARMTFASIMGVEAQHVSILLVVKALLTGGTPELVVEPPNLARFPAAAGHVGLTDSFFKTDQARPAGEGAVA